MKKKLASFILAITMLASLSSMAFATDSANDSHEFVELTREQYISSKADTLGISYEEAEAIVDENIQQTLALIPTPLKEIAGFNAQDGYTDQYGVNTAYGYIIYYRDIPNTLRKLSARMSVYAVIISAPSGRYVSDLGSATVIPGKSGEYALDASCNARISSDKQSVYISADGNAEITRSEAEHMDFTLEIISFGQSHGSDYHLRYPFTIGVTYTV